MLPGRCGGWWCVIQGRADRGRSWPSAGLSDDVGAAGVAGRAGLANWPVVDVPVAVRSVRLVGTPSWLSRAIAGIAGLVTGALAAGAGRVGIAVSSPGAPRPGVLVVPRAGVPAVPGMGDTGMVVGAPARAEALLSADAADCSSAAALAGLVAKFSRMLRAGTLGIAGGAAGSAAASGLSTRAAEPSPAVVIMAAANSFAGRVMPVVVAPSSDVSDMVILILRWLVDPDASLLQELLK